MTISRRSFLKTSAATAAVSLTAGPVSRVSGKAHADVQPGPGNTWPGRVVINYNKGAAAGTSVEPAVVKTMIDESIMLLTDQKTVGDAWKAVLPSVSASSTIAIKVPLGCAAKEVAPHWSSVKAIVDGLRQMDFDGTPFPAGNITIYEMECSDRFVKYGYTSENIPDVKILRDSYGTGFTDGARGLQYATSLSSTFLINVFRPGGHGMTWGGFTLGFKNHFGSYKPDHGSGAHGYLRDINCTGVVYNKSMLSVCIGLFGAKEASGQPGSPAVSYYHYVKSTFDHSIPPPEGTVLPNILPNTIIMSTDPVAAEMQTVKMMRLNKDPAGPCGIEDMPTYLKASGGVEGALSDATYNIGVIDEKRMNLRRIVNGEIVAIGNPRPDAASKRWRNDSRITVSRLKAQGIAFVEYSLPQSFIGSQAAMEIRDLKSAIVHEAKQRVAGTVNHFSWDERSTGGRKVPAGLYVVRVIAGKIRLSGKLIIPG
ncbi:MAG: DUF362 domain-containing protein [Chitinispirillaceae bacterium]|nr:DUF362 domain-containing protein [Chitinispirillaceae bacterium]